jgi:hypothetical protein
VGELYKNIRITHTQNLQTRLPAKSAASIISSTNSSSAPLEAVSKCSTAAGITLEGVCGNRNRGDNLWFDRASTVDSGESVRNSSGVSRRSLPQLISNEESPLPSLIRFCDKPIPSAPPHSTKEVLLIDAEGQKGVSAYNGNSPVIAKPWCLVSGVVPTLGAVGRPDSTAEEDELTSREMNRDCGISLICRGVEST